jgi:hypothetical protein
MPRWRRRKPVRPLCCSKNINSTSREGLPAKNNTGKKERRFFARQLRLSMRSRISTALSGNQFSDPQVARRPFRTHEVVLLGF